jgi:hypothetical protein
VSGSIFHNYYEEIEMVDVLELVFEMFKCIDGEIGGNKGEMGIGKNVGLQKIADFASVPIIPDSRVRYKG